MIPAAYPQLRLDADALHHNIRVMAEWCKTNDVALAPHVKTTMSAPIIERQRAAGASTVTVATVDQAQTVWSWGHHSVLIANQVVDRFGLERLKVGLEEDSARRIQCFVDSPEGIVAAEQVFDAHGPALHVLLDVGAPGGRTGIRRHEDARRLARRVNGAPGLRLVGVAGYEGVAPNNRIDETLAAVDDHCRRVRDIYIDVADLFETDAPVYSMGGSAFPDRVVECLPTDKDVPGTVRLLRSGCYVTHDHGTYRRVSPIPNLVPAASIRSVVLSVPEDGMAVVGAGKRDLPYDADLPTLLAAHRPGGSPKYGVAGTVHTLYDHHAVLTGVTGLAVADLVDFGISHPCSVFDRWPDYLVTNSGGEVIDVWRTDFHRASIISAKEPTTEVAA
ncbi:alanine racemase [Streptomyces sp. NPDC048644]|uniref:alanine racemase n=1 Tax=Streptomyces sp. NPDC048644 TaxID=3365582 RepID=UPI00371F0729